MKIYLDLIFLINFSFDTILLFTVSILLKRNIKMKKIFLGGLIGSISTLLLFLKINSFELFIIKIIISILMVLGTFSYKNIKYTINNILFLYFTSILLGGFLYYINIEYSYIQEGLIFFHTGISPNIIVLVLISPIILYIYIRQARIMKTNYSYYYEVDIFLKNKEVIKTTGFLNTGNRLKDPYLNRPIIIINKNKIKQEITDYLLVPMNTISNNSLLKCITIDKIEIKGIGTKTNILLGISPKKINMEGIDCILCQSILER